MQRKVLVVAPHIGKGGGREKSVVSVGANLAEAGHTVIFLTTYDVTPRLDIKEKYISLVKQKKNYPFEFTISIFQTAMKIARVCKKESIDTVLAFGLQSNLSAIFSRIFFRNKSKIIVSVRSDMRVENRKAKYQIKSLFPKADKVVAISKGVENNLIKEFGLKNTVTIYNLQIQDLKKTDRQAEKKVDVKHKKIFDENFIFINVGRPSKQKGQWHLIRSFKHVSDVRNNCKLLILGGGKLIDELDLMIKKLGLEDEVFLLGRIDNVYPYLKKSDCFVFTSYFEGFGNVLTEALSQNLPVISTDCVSGPREILCPEIEIDAEINYPYHGKYGILTKPFNEEMHFKTIDEKPLTREEKTFAEMMIKMIEDQNLKMKYSKGRERLYSEEFDADNLIKEWEKLL